MAPQTIAVIGALDADLIMITPRIPSGGEMVQANEYIEALGGKGANSAIATYRTCHKSPTSAAEGLSDPSHDDIKVKMIGAVGSDQYRDKFLTELTKNNIDTSGIIAVHNTRSSVCFVLVEHATRENRCLFTLGATATWKKEHFATPSQLSGGGDPPDLVIAQMEIAKDVVSAAIETAGKADIDVCLNAAPASPIDKRLYKFITHLLVNESEAAIMSGRARGEVNADSWAAIAQEFLTLGVKNVVITLGAKGAFYANTEGSAHCPGYEVIVRDTNGAG